MLATGLKQLPAAIDEISLPDMWEQMEFWNQWPPEHVLLRGFTGYKPPVPSLSASDMSDLTTLLGPKQVAPKYISDLVKWAEETSESLGIKRGQA